MIHKLPGRKIGCYKVLLTEVPAFSDADGIRSFFDSAVDVQLDDKARTALVTFGNQAGVESALAKRSLTVGGETIFVQKYDISSTVLMGSEECVEGSDYVSQEEEKIKIMVENLPVSVDEEYLEMFFESRKFKGCVVVAVDLNSDLNNAIVTFQRGKDVETILENVPIMIKKQEVTVKKYKPAPLCTIIVRGPNVNEENLELLEMYFDNEKKSGGGEVVENSARYDAKKDAVYITFESEVVAKRVVERGRHVLKKGLLVVGIAYPEANVSTDPNTMSTAQQRMSGTNNIHSHCSTCVKISCIQNSVCAVVSCKLKCGQQFHSCKAYEHSLLCKKELAFCTNKVNGCELVLPRKDIAKHLEFCSANLFRSDNPMELVTCKKGCGISYHACRDVEHKYICKKETVKCTNSEFGCPLEMKRENINYHLQFCPASVVVCQSKWLRRPMLSGNEMLNCAEIKERPRIIFGQMELAFAIMDQDKVIEGAKLPQGQKMYERPLTNPSRLSVVPFRSDMEIRDVLAFASPSIYYATINSTRERQLRGMYTFRCGKELRRDEFPGHMKTLHDNIQQNTHGWFEQRCPLASHGCTFSFQRFRPTTSNVPKFITASDTISVRYNSLAEPVLWNKDGVCNFNEHQSDLITDHGRFELHTSLKLDNSITVVKRSETVLSQTKTSIIELPFKVLILIANYLDAISLRRLSRTNKLLQSVCCCLLNKKGFVSIVWKKRGNRWETINKKWKFSDCFESIDGWEFKEESPAIMLKHLKVCKFNQEEYLNRKANIGPGPSVLFR
ncbi:FBX40-like protein [Mya arenaria]|uniref:FBX40-like protein n=1 Tax=Mya arenaria TaxID=6604 RepID=A0ABY7FNS9_MYAAR|nr:FBX40-like protein [Mya arenaria]